MKRKSAGWFDWLNVVMLLIVVIVTLYPFLYMLNVSLSSSSYVLRNEVALWPKGFTFEMYDIVFKDSRIMIGYKNTLIYVVLGTLISMLLTSMGAYALSRKMVFSKAYTLMIVFTMVFQGGMIPTFLVVRGMGLMDTVWGMVLPGAVSVWNLIIMRTFFAGIPGELTDAGYIDGLNDIGIFARLIIPLSKPVLATISLFYAVSMWNNFYLPLLFLRDADLFPLTVILRNLVMAGQFDSGVLGSGDDFIVEESLKYATIIVSTLPIILVYPFIQKYFVKGVMIGSIKG